MKLTVTGTVKEFPEGTTIAQLIAAENVETPDYVTVSVNDAFAQNDAFATTALHDGDTVEFLYFMGGGR
ncbi:MAG: sulfur carrier protein ThiS [Clostridia bacterium]|nr:sulfur carrier protein ThiS [Clostridia bacterium]